MSTPINAAYLCADTMRIQARREIMAAENDIMAAKKAIEYATDRRDRAATDLAGANLMLAFLEPAYREQSEMAATERMMLEDDLSVEG